MYSLSYFDGIIEDDVMHFQQQKHNLYNSEGFVYSYQLSCNKKGLCFLSF